MLLTRSLSIAATERCAMADMGQGIHRCPDVLTELFPRMQFILSQEYRVAIQAERCHLLG